MPSAVYRIFQIMRPRWVSEKQVLIYSKFRQSWEIVVWINCKRVGPLFEA